MSVNLTCREMGKNSIDNICLIEGLLGPGNGLVFSLGQGESRRGNRGWAEAVEMW